jgi:glycosyltransferase involved in cell wall biosynthesis
MSPFFTVVIPVYNRADTLRIALESVLAQTLQDFEVIVSDDGSTDDPKRVVDALNDPRLVYVRKHNRGGGAARNTGIDMAKGRCVAFLDSDDVYLPRHLETLKPLLEGTTDIVAYARTEVDRGDGRAFLKPPRAIRTGEDMASYLFCDRGFVPTNTVAMSTVLARKVRYSESLRIAEDADFAVRLQLAGCKFVMAEAPGAVWKDFYDPSRTSSGRRAAKLAQWAEEMRGRIPERAYHGLRGWAYAKQVAKTDKGEALWLYLTALRHRCYSPRLSAVVFLQIFLPERIYRGLADAAIRWLRAGFRGRRGKPQPVQAA